MFYLSLIRKIAKYYFLELLLFVLLTFIFFMSIFQLEKIRGMTREFMPSVKKTAYMNIVLQGNYPDDRLQAFKEKLPSIESVKVLDSISLKASLIQKLKEKGLPVDPSLINAEKTFLRIYLKGTEKESFFPMIQKQIEKEFRGFSAQVSPVEISKVELLNLDGIRFWREWAEEVILLLCFFTWLLTFIFFYRRIYLFLTLSSRFQYRSYTFEKFYSISLFSLMAVVVSVDSFIERSLNMPAILLCSAFILIFLGSERFLRFIYAEQGAKA